MITSRPTLFSARRADQFGGGFEGSRSGAVLQGDGADAGQALNVLLLPGGDEGLPASLARPFNTRVFASMSCRP
jgi:hypothetical protein